MKILLFLIVIDLAGKLLVFYSGKLLIRVSYTHLDVYKRQAQSYADHQDIAQHIQLLTVGHRAKIRKYFLK